MELSVAQGIRELMELGEANRVNKLMDSVQRMVSSVAHRVTVMHLFHRRKISDLGEFRDILGVRVDGRLGGVNRR